MLYNLVLGLEIHLQPTTNRKMFCRCSAKVWKEEPNTHTCPVCLGLPGSLPVPNRDAVKKTQILGLALNCSLNKNSKFDRKHYFYPDLPKGYQISQYKEPLCYEGYLDLSNGRRIGIERIHLEEDTAKSFHRGDKSLIDFNTSGMPLIEIVTKPDFRTVEEASEFGREIQRIVRYIEIGDVDMEKGQMRLEPNISVRSQEDEDNNILPPFKVEIKNINSFKFMEKAVTAEIKRQSALLESGEMPVQENRGFREDTGETVSQRSKEDAHDYRYFPEPDIPPMLFDDSYLESLAAEVPELPEQLIKRIVDTHSVSIESATNLVNSFGKDMVLRFEQLVEAGLDSVKALNTLLNKKDYQGLSVNEFKVKFEEENTKMGEEDLKFIVQDVISKNPDPVEQYKLGNENILNFLLGMVMRETNGKADAVITISLLKEFLS